MISSSSFLAALLLGVGQNAGSGFPQVFLYKRHVVDESQRVRSPFLPYERKLVKNPLPTLV
jgi:hypothetical protein